MPVTIDDLKMRLEKSKHARIFGFPGLRACCPAHQDDNPSFYAWEGDDGWLHVRCSKCSEDDICKALDLTEDDRRLTAKADPAPSIQYLYDSPDGKHVLMKVRKTLPGGKKDFRLWGWDVSKFVPTLSHMNGQRYILYNARKVRTAIAAGVTVYINEGEKACDLMTSHGLVGTCQPFGADKDPKNKWRDEYTLFLKGAKVCIVADRDEVGEAYAQYVAAQLVGVAKSVKVVQSKTTKEKDDAYDHLISGGSEKDWHVRDDLLPTSDDFTVVTLDDVQEEPADFLWEPYFRLRHINLVDAKGGSMKTTMVIAFACGGSIGVLPFGGKCEPFTTILFNCEDTQGEAKVLFNKIGGGDPKRLVHITDHFQLNASGLAKVERLIQKTGAKLVVFDALSYYLAGLIRNPLDGMEIAPHLNRLRDLARKTDTAIVNVRHFAKYSKDKDVTEMGAGAEQWRNSHRTQLVLRPHPEASRYTFVQPAKGSLIAGAGEAFAFSMQNDIFGWIKDPDLSVFDQASNISGTKLEAAKVFIRELCTDQFILSDQAWKQVKAAGHADATIKRALASMKEAGEITYKRFDKNGPYHWHIPVKEVVDPFE